VSIIIQRDATIYSLFISVNCSTCFGWYLHPSSGAHITVTTVTGIVETVTANCRERHSVEIPPSGVPRNFFGGGGVSTNSVEDRRQGNGDLGAVAPQSGVLEAAVIWYKKFHFI